MSGQLHAKVQERQRIEVMRLISDTAIRLFYERGYDHVTVETVGNTVGVSPATIYRRFGTKENLVCWQPDEWAGYELVLRRLREGARVIDAAREAVQNSPEDAMASVEATGQMRLELIAANPALRAASRVKAETFVSEALAASAESEGLSLLEREVQVTCVAAAMQAATAAYARGDGPLRTCLQQALDALGDLHRPAASH
jgi:AcrR family transcriptional regulator